MPSVILVQTMRKKKTKTIALSSRMTYVSHSVAAPVVPSYRVSHDTSICLPPCLLPLS